MKIAFISLMGGLPWGGSEALWHAIAIHALQQGNEVFVSVYDWGTAHEKIKSLQEKGAIIHFRKRYNSHAGTVEKIKRFVQNRKPALNKDYQSIIDFKPETVFISQGDSFDLSIHHRAFYLLLRQNNISYSFVCHNHDQYSFIPPKEIYPGAQEIFKNAKQVYFVSHRQWRLTERRLAMKITNGQFTWNPLNVEIPTTPLLWPQNVTVNMAIVGNLSGGKGHDTAFEALSSQEWKDREWQLNIYGEGEGKKYLEDLAQFYGIKDKVNFYGHVANVLKVWETNHLLLIPSAGEGLPISLVEAMACGRAAVVTDVGGNIELVSENQTGFIAVSPTTEAFAVAMEKAWKNKTQWEKMGIAAFEKIYNTIDADPHIKIYDTLKD